LAHYCAIWCLLTRAEPYAAPRHDIRVNGPIADKSPPTRAGVREVIEARGARLLYLPPYSPDFNPIEQLFAKLKALLRKAAERSISALWDRIGEIVQTITSDECSNYFCHAGYA
jgi:transposase